VGYRIVPSEASESIRKETRLDQDGCGYRSGTGAWQCLCIDLLWGSVELTPLCCVSCGSVVFLMVRFSYVFVLLLCWYVCWTDLPDLCVAQLDILPSRLLIWRSLRRVLLNRTSDRSPYATRPELRDAWGVIGERRRQIGRTTCLPHNAYM